MAGRQGTSAEQVLLVAGRHPNVDAGGKRPRPLAHQGRLRTHEQIADTARRPFDEVLMR